MPSDTRISVREKIGFSLGDGAANLVFQTMMLLQLSFYTDTFGLAAGTAVTLFLVARLWGAVADPVMEAVGDRTNFSRAFFSNWLTSLLIVQCSRIRAGVICALQ